MGMDIPHLVASGMGGIRTAGDLVARMMYTKNMKLNDAKRSEEHDRVKHATGCDCGHDHA